MRFGNLDIDLLDLSPILMDGGAVFGIIPKPLWQRLIPSDERNRIRLGLHCLLIRSPDFCMLVEAGVGDKLNERLYDIYGIDRSLDLPNLLAERGVAAEAVTHVVFSHLHFLPAGGGTVRRQEGVVPTFPNADYLVQRAEYECASHPNEHTRGSYAADDFRPLMEAGQLRLIDGRAEVAPGVELIPTGGHTAGHQIVLVSAGGQRMAYLGHLIPTAWHLTPHYIMAYDGFPMEILAQKKAILEQAAAEKWLLVFLNNPNHAAGYLHKTDSGFALEPVDL